MSYNDRGQLTSESATYGGQTYTVSYSYDTRGRRDEVTHPSGRKAEYSYTDRGLIDTIKWDGSEIENRDYNVIGQLTSIDRPSVDESRTYDARGRIHTIANGAVGTATYAYDANGNKLSESWSGAMSPWNFTTQSSGSDGYDAEDRFMNFNQSGQSRTLAMTRSEIGNITNVSLNGTSTTRSYSNAHELTSIGANSQSFDADGNLTSSTGGDTYDWDEAGMMEQATVAGGQTVNYGYSADGKRIWKKVGTAETVYIHSGPNCIAEYTKGAAPSSSGNEYVYAGGIDSIVMLVRSAGNEKLAVTRNQQWSISALINASGSVVERYTYAEFGKRTILTANGATVRNSSSCNMPYGYTSRHYEAETSLMYFRARYYDTYTGEFISRDPLEYVDGMSQYRGYFVPKGLDPNGSDLVDVGNKSPSHEQCIRYCSEFEGSDYLRCYNGCMAKNKPPSPPNPPTPPPLPATGNPHTAGTDERNEILGYVKCICPNCKDCVRRLFESTKFKFKPPSLNDQCVAWQDQWKPPTDCGHCYTIQQEFYEYPWIGLGWKLAHTASKITLCGSRVFYIDNGWWGGKFAEYFPGAGGNVAGGDPHIYDVQKPSCFVTPLK